MFLLLNINTKITSLVQYHEPNLFKGWKLELVVNPGNGAGVCRVIWVLDLRILRFSILLPHVWWKYVYQPFKPHRVREGSREMNSLQHAVNFIHKWLLCCYYIPHLRLEILVVVHVITKTSIYPSWWVSVCTMAGFHRGNAQALGDAVRFLPSFSLLHCTVVIDCKSCSTVLETHDLEHIPGPQIAFFFPSPQVAISEENNENKLK